MRTRSFTAAAATATTALALVSALLVACAGELENPQEFNSDGTAKTASGNVDVSPASCGDVTVTVFKKDCASAGCHGASSPAAGLDLESDGVGARLKGKVASASGFVLLDPAAPEQSAVYTKLSSPAPFGTRMPLGQAPASAQTRACVLKWVKGVAAGG